jgi:hypothetical protein
MAVSPVVATSTIGDGSETAGVSSSFTAFLNLCPQLRQAYRVTRMALPFPDLGFTSHDLLMFNSSPLHRGHTVNDFTASVFSEIKIKIYVLDKLLNGLEKTFGER